MPAPPRDQIESMALSVASGQTIRRWAEEHDVCERTARSWAATPLFKGRLRELRDDLIDRTLARLTRASSAAVTSLIQIIGDPEAPHAAKVGAARTLLTSLI